MYTTGDVLEGITGLTLILIEKVERPDEEWIAIQEDERVRSLPPDVVWWDACPLSGGAVWVAEPLCVFIRKATPGDIQAAFANGNGSAKEKLVELFPEFLLQSSPIATQSTAALLR